MTADVLVIGESLIDIVQRADRTVTEVVGGSPANVAFGLARQSVAVRFHTALARDERGARIAAQLRGEGVELVEASWSLAATSTALAEIAADGAARYTFDLEWALPVTPRVGDATLVHVGSIAAFLEPGASVVEHVLGGTDTLVSFDPNIRGALLPDRREAALRFERLAALADVVKLSDEDGSWLYPGASLAEVIAEVAKHGPRLVAITRGGAGALLHAAGVTVDVAAPVVRVQDTVGAGDTFMAALIREVLATTDVLGAPTAERLATIGAYAAAAAALTVQRVGADLPRVDEVAAALRA